MIPPYARQSPPEGIDHREFGEPCGSVALADSHASAGFARTITVNAPVELPAGRSYRPSSETEIDDNFLGACRAEFVDCRTSEFAATVFPPDHAVYVPGVDGGYVVQESLWHSDLFFSDWFRNDVTTNWQWRVKQSWTPSFVISEPINYCYHRFHYQYFHWLIDCVSRIWLLKKQNLEANSAKWLIGPLNSQVQIETIRLFDISVEDCVWLDAQSIELKRMIYPTFEFREPLKTRPSYHNGVHHRGWWPAYLAELRDRAITRHSHPGVESDLKLYITRGDSQHRQIINQAEVDALIDELGFMRVTPGNLPFERQVAIFSHARVIVGTHGAGMTNLIWAAPGARLLEFMPASLGDPGYRFLAQLCGHDYACLFVKTLDHPLGTAFANIEIDIDALRRALTEILE